MRFELSLPAVGRRDPSGELSEQLSRVELSQQLLSGFELSLVSAETPLVLTIHEYDQLAAAELAIHEYDQR